MAESLGSIYAGLSLKLDGFENNANKAIKVLDNMKNSTSNFSKTMDSSMLSSTSKMELLTKEFEKIDTKYKNVFDFGDKFSSIGNKLTLGVTVPVIGAGTAVGKLAMDFDSSFAKVSTLLDSSTTDLSKYKNELVNASNETGVALNDFNEAVYESMSAGVDSGKAIAFTTDAIKLAKGGFTSASSAVDVMTTAINGYKLEAKDATRISNLLINTQNLGKTTVDELASSFGTVIPTASALNFNIEELSTSYAVLTKNGIATAESGTYLRSMLGELGKAGSKTDKALKELSGKGFAELKKEGKSTTDILSMLENYAKKNKESLKDMFGSIEAGSAALVLANGNGKEYNEMLKSMQNSTGVAEEAFNKMADTTKERFNKALNEAKNSAMKLGEKVIPMVEKGINLFSDLVDKFNSLSPATQEAIIKTALLSAALGPLAKVTGTTINGVATLGKGIEKANKAFGIFKGVGAATTAVEGLGTAASVAGGAAGVGGLTTGLGSVIATVAPFALATAAIGGSAYAVYKAFNEEVIPEVDLFADKVEVTSESIQNANNDMGNSIETTTTKISEETKKAVQSYLDMDEGVKTNVMDLYMSNSEITENIKKDTIDKISEMKNTVINGYKEQKDKGIAELNELFSNSKDITEKEQQELLKKQEDYYKNKQTEMNIYEKQINDILTQASDAKRAITDDEAKTINDIQNRMRTNAVKALSEQAVESEIILQRMKDYDTRMTDEQCADHVKKINEARDKVVSTANDEYEQRIQAIIKMRDESKTITAEQADKLIAEAKRQRDGIVDNAEYTRQEALDKVREMNSQLDKEVNLETGEILKWWEKLGNWWEGWNPKRKVFSYTIESSGGTSGGNIKAGTAMAYASGTSALGLSRDVVTTMNERGYELYQLNRGDRIWNNQASEAIVIETAEKVAEKVVSRMIENMNGGDIIMPINIAGEKIDEIIVPRVSNKLAIKTKGRR